MFQKLYRHLEDINASLHEKEDDTAANLAREKMLDQLRQLNDSIRTREAQLVSARRAIARYVGICSGLIIFCMAAFIFAEIRLQPAETPAKAPVFVGPPAEEVHYRENVQKLDSLVAEQAQTIKELTKLNRSAVYSLRQIRKHFEELDKKALAATEGQTP